MRAAGLDLSTRHLDLVVIDTDNPAACEHRRVDLGPRSVTWWGAGEVWQHLNWIPAGDPDEFSALDWLRHHQTAILGIERPYGPSSSFPQRRM